MINRHIPTQLTLNEMIRVCNHICDDINNIRQGQPSSIKPIGISAPPLVSVQSGISGIGSLGLNMPSSVFSVSLPNPLIASGSFTVSFTNQSTGVFAAPLSSPGPPVFRNLTTTDIPDLSSEYIPSVENVTLGPGTWVTNQPFKIVGGVTVAITSLDLDVPICNGILLESGSTSQTVKALMMQNIPTTTPSPLPGTNGDILWLAQTASSLTAIVPSIVNGDIWSYPLGVRSSQYSLIFQTGLLIGL